MKQRLLETLTRTPQSRESLCRRLGCSDRTLRMLVTELRMDGEPVCSNSQTKGYWLGTQADRKHLAAEYRHRGAQMYHIANKLEAGARKEQIQWDV